MFDEFLASTRVRRAAFIILEHVIQLQGSAHKQLLYFRVIRETTMLNYHRFVHCNRYIL